MILMRKPNKTVWSVVLLIAFVGLLLPSAPVTPVYADTAGVLTGQRVIATLPGSDTVLPFELYPNQTGTSSDMPCYITVPAGTAQIAIKKDPAKTITSLVLYDADGNTFTADEGVAYSVTVPAAATLQHPYAIVYQYKLGSRTTTAPTIYFYCVEENGPNPFVTSSSGTMSSVTVLENDAVSLNVSGTGSPAQAVEWHYAYYENNEKVYQKLEDETGETLNIAASQQSLNLGHYDEAYDNYYLFFYAEAGDRISNEIEVIVKGASTGAKSLEASNWGSYAGARLWLNVGATFGNQVTADTPVKFYLTAVENGTADTAVAGTLLETTVAAVPATASQGEKGMGFLADNLPAGGYWLAIQVGTGAAPFYRYKPFTVYPGVREYVKAALDKMISWYQTEGMVSGGKYVGLSVWNDSGTAWKAWILADCGYAASDPLLAGADGKTYLNGLETLLSNRDADDNSAKDDFCYIASLCALGANPRDFNGRNLVADLIGQAYNANGALRLDANGALDVEPDILATSYLLLGAEISGATAAEGYTDALKKAGIKAILPTVETSVNAGNAGDIASTDWLAMQSYPLYFLQDDDQYGARITEAIGKMAGVVSAHLYANGGLNMSWPGVNSAGSYDPVIPADGYGSNPDSMAVMLNALVLFGTTADDLENNAWQKDWGTLVTALLGLQQADGSIGFNGASNDMATYQTLGALVELYTGRSCFVNARETYLSQYPAVPVTGLTLEPDSLTLTTGGSAALTATITPPDATDQSVYWTTSDQTVATVVYNGVSCTVTGHAPGTATITVTANDGGYTEHCAVTVNSLAGAPAITPGGGSYDAPQSITVSISADLAVDQAVYYTTDGSDPTVAGSVYYTGPFSLYLPQGTTTVRAAVYDSGTGIWSAMTEAAFTVAPPVQNSYDLNGDDLVNVQDMVLIGQCFAETGTSGWIDEDINQDGKINIQDLVLVGQHFTS